MFPYFPAKRLQKLRGISRSTEAPTLKLSMLPEQTHKAPDNKLIAQILYEEEGLVASYQM